MNIQDLDLEDPQIDHKVSDSSPISLLREKVIPKATLNLFENKYRGQSSDEDNPYEAQQKHKNFSAFSEESEVIMFRADESSMFEDKNLPVSNCYSPSKCSKLTQHAFHKFGHHQSSNLSTSGPQGSSPLNHFAKSATLSFNQATQFKGLMPMMIEDFIEET